MYSRKVVERKLAAFREKYGWEPVPHSPEEIDDVAEHMKTLYRRQKNGDLVFDDDRMTPALTRWIQNERAMCAMDCEYYLTRYHYISAENRIFRFKFRGGQRVLFEVMGALEEQGVAIEIQLLKARQGGFSTAVEGVMTHRSLFVPGVKAAIASANDQKTYVMMGMFYTALDNLPWWLPPRQTKDKRSGAAVLEFASIGSQIVVQSGSMRGGIGQGTTPTAIHISECCDYPNALVTIEEGLFKAVHSGPEILMILESTGNGNSGWWADQWRNNKEFYFQGRSRLYPLFIPWFMTPELYPKREWLDKFQIPYAWEPNAATRQVVAKCEAYARNSEALRPVIGSDWRMPRDQQWFWEFNYEDAKRRKTDKSWLRHMPCDDFDALIGDNDSSFDRDAIVSIDSARKKNCQVYGILGEGIPEKHDPDPAAVDYDEPRVTVNWRTVHDVNLSWMLMPLKGDVESSGFDPLKKLLVWEPPERNALYSVGVDTGFGVGGDRTIITVNRCGQDSVPDMQVAEYAADDIGNTEVYAWAMAIAAWYGKFMEEGQTPRFVIEQRRKFGDSCYHALKLHGFRNHHSFRTYDRKTLRPVPSAHQAEGWYTNEWSRPLLLGTFKHAVENGWYTLNSRFTLAEVEALEQIVGTSGKVRQDHRYGEHDDRVFAAAMAYITWHDNDLMAERSKQKYAGPEERSVEVDYGPAVMSVPNPGADEFFAQFLEG